MDRKQEDEEVVLGLEDDDTAQSAQSAQSAFVLVASDGTRISTNMEWCRNMSGFIQSAAKFGGDTSTIDVKNVNGETLQLVVDFIEHHKGVHPTSSDAWTKAFLQNIQDDRQALADVSNAACFLGIHSLLDMCTKTIAALISGIRSPAECRRILTTRSDGSSIL